MGTTQDYENYFFEISGYENPMVEKNKQVYSRIYEEIISPLTKVKHIFTI